MNQPQIAYLRSLLTWVVSLVSMVILGFIGITISLFTSSNDTHHRICQLWGKIVMWISGIRVDVQGVENINPDKAQVIISNHQGNFDVWTFLAYMPLQFRWVMKKELFRIPFLGGAIKRAGYIGIDRQHPRQAVRDMARVLATLKEGRSVIIFPEGTRTRDGRVGEFKRGGFVLAYKSGASILPISISGSFGIMQKGSCWISPQPIKIVIQPPVTVTDLSKEAQHQLPEQVRQMIIDRL